MTATGSAVLGLAALVGLVTGCSTGGVSTGLPAIHNAAEAQARWTAIRPRHYSFTYLPVCLCTEVAGRVTVTDGVVVDWVAQPIAGATSPVDSSLTRAQAPTVDSLLAEAVRAEKEATGEVAITYDPATGIPVSARIDWYKDSWDDEIAWNITEVETPGPVTATGGSGTTVAAGGSLPEHPAGITDAEQARARWLKVKPRRYAFTYQPSCFCGLVPGRITVSGDTVTDWQPDPTAHATGGTGRLPDNAPTIDQLIAEVARAEHTATGPVVVTFDPATGVPVDVSIDWIKGAVDDEKAWHVIDLVALADPPSTLVPGSPKPSPPAPSPTW